MDVHLNKYIGKYMSLSIYLSEWLSELLTAMPAYDVESYVMLCDAMIEMLVTSAAAAAGQEW